MIDSKGDILVVDDTPANLDVLTAMLGEHGYKVRPAIHGEMALNAARASAPDLILLDINMPDMNGYEVCKILKADGELRDIPVIFISAMDETIDKIRAFDVGGVDYVTKPFEFEEVIVRVDSQLTLYRQRLQLETMRAKERQQYEDLNRLKDQFLYSVTHDIKNPLAVITLYVGLLKTLPELEMHPKGFDYLDKIQNASDQVRDLITDLLELVRIGTGMGISKSEVPLNNLLMGCLDGFVGLADRKDININFYPSDENPIVLVDPRRMMQVINNLLSNAIKYTPDNGTINLVGRIEGKYVLIEVSDTGFGIPEADLPYIFDKFYRVNHEEHLVAEGTGLGLAIVKALVENHGGIISVASDFGAGTTFTIRLPMQN